MTLRKCTAGIPVFGPTANAAAMEGSKTFSKSFMSRHNIPTAAYENFSSYDAAHAYLKSISHPIVIKASGLAGGKGVLIPSTTEEAIQGLQDLMVSKEFGQAGEEVVIEEFMTGQELSILAFSDGYTVLALPGAQDHKRIGEGDTGLNTGGMGAYAPAPCATKEIEEEIMRTIVRPTIAGMRKEGPFIPPAPSYFFGFVSVRNADDLALRQVSLSSDCSLPASCLLRLVRNVSSSTCDSGIRKRKLFCRCSRRKPIWLKSSSYVLLPLPFALSTAASSRLDGAVKQCSTSIRDQS